MIARSSSGASTTKTARHMANRILTVLDQPFSIHGALIRIGASIGIASQRNVAQGGDYLLRAADIAMYASKGQGKHRWQLFNPHVHGPIETSRPRSILAGLPMGDLDTLGTT